MANYLRFIFFLIVGLGLIILCYPNVRDITIRVLHSTIIPYEENLHKRNIRSINAFKQDIDNRKNIDLLFIGDSHFVKMFNKTSSLTNYLSISINGETTRGILNRFDININNLHYKKAIILLGYNDLKCRNTNSTFQNYKQIINKLTCDSVYIVSLLPVKFNRYLINRQIKDINLLLQTYSFSQRKLHYIQVYDLFLNNKGNGINSSYSYDGTHLNIRGNNILSNSILKKIK